jgi:hypothetical protein
MPSTGLNSDLSPKSYLLWTFTDGRQLIQVDNASLSNTHDSKYYHAEIFVDESSGPISGIVFTPPPHKNAVGNLSDSVYALINEAEFHVHVDSIKKIRTRSALTDSEYRSIEDQIKTMINYGDSKLR